VKIKVRDIPRDGLTIRETVNAKEIGLTPEDLKCLSPLAIAAQVEKAENAVIVHAEVEGSFELECGRCLDPIVEKSVKDFEMYFETDPSVEFVDLGEELRQEMILAFWGKEVCKEDCKGLCPNCGANLNREKCKCAKRK
jgi:uncharacterized protein